MVYSCLALWKSWDSSTYFKLPWKSCHCSVSFPLFLFSFEHKLARLLTPLFTKTARIKTSCDFQKSVFSPHPTLLIELYFSLDITRLVHFQILHLFLFSLLPKSFLIFPLSKWWVLRNSVLWTFVFFCIGNLIQTCGFKYPLTLVTLKCVSPTITSNL